MPESLAAINFLNHVGNSAVSGLLLCSILIAAPLKARRVPLTVQILICVIAFQSGRSTTGVGNSTAGLPPTHSKTGDMLQWRLWSVGCFRLLPREMWVSLCQLDLHSGSKCWISRVLVEVWASSKGLWRWQGVVYYRCRTQQRPGVLRIGYQGWVFTQPDRGQDWADKCSDKKVQKSKETSVWCCQRRFGWFFQKQILIISDTQHFSK